MTRPGVSRAAPGKDAHASIEAMRQELVEALRREIQGDMDSVPAHAMTCTEFADRLGITIYAAQMRLYRLVKAGKWRRVAVRRPGSRHWEYLYWQEPSGAG